MTARQKITPCLWFDGNAEEAVHHYVSVFDDARIQHVARYGPAGPGPEGSVMLITFLLAGQEFIALNGGPQFHFTEAISLFVSCETQQEVDRYWEELAAGGQTSQCGWLKDRFGLSWQIVPRVLGEMMRDEDPERRGRVMEAMLAMRKLEIAPLEAAYGPR